MARGEFFPIIACTDLLRTRDFYEKAFGAVENYRFPTEGTPAYIAMKLGSSSIGLGDGTGLNAYGERALPATGHPVDLCLYVDDLDATLATATSHGGTLVSAPADMPWGERVAWLRDPEGIMLLVIRADD